MTIMARSLDGREIEPHTCVFPILKEVDSETNQMIGTGFFITNIGHFVTAKHVIEDIFIFEKKKQMDPLNLFINPPPNPPPPPPRSCPFLKFFPPPGTDKIFKRGNSSTFVA